MHFSFALLAATALSAVAVPVPARVAARQSTANTGLGSLLNANLTQSRLDVAEGLKEMSTALSTLSSSGSAKVKTLAKSATSDVSRAQAGVDTIGQNIIKGVDPNTGNNPQGEVAAGIVAANKTVAQISALSKASAVSDLQSGLASALAGGEGVLAAQNKTLSSVLGPNGEPLPASTSSSSSSTTNDAASSSSGGLGGVLSGLGLKEEPEKRQTGASNPLSGLLGSLGGGASSSTTGGAAGGLGGILGGLTGGATGSSTAGTSTAGTSTTGTSTSGGLAGLFGGLGGAGASSSSTGAAAGGLGSLLGGLGGGATSGATGTSTSSTGGAASGGLAGLLGSLGGGATAGATGATGTATSGGLAGLLSGLTGGAGATGATGTSTSGTSTAGGLGALLGGAGGRKRMVKVMRQR